MKTDWKNIACLKTGSGLKSFYYLWTTLYNKIDELIAGVSSGLDDFLGINDPDMCAQGLITVIQSKVSEISTIRSSRHTTPIQPWVTPGILRSINIRNSLLRDFLKERVPEKLNKFKKYRNVLRLTMRHAKQSYYRSQFTKNSGNPKRLWADLLDAIQKRKVHVELPYSFQIGDSVPAVLAVQRLDPPPQVAYCLVRPRHKSSHDRLEFKSR